MCATVETGGAADFQYGDKPGGLYAKAKVDQVLHDGDKGRVGWHGAHRASDAGPHAGLHHLDHDCAGRGKGL